MNKAIAFVLGVSFMWPVAYAQELSSIAKYPKAGKNENRNVIWLEKIDHEENYKVEIIATKQGMTDCNTRSYHTDLKKKDLKGWGYDYFVVGKADQVISTLMGCLDNKKTLADIPVVLPAGESIQRYNSRLPIVVYAPKDIQIKYKIWKADKIVPAVISNE
ncbi:ecotin family protein [Acinetobacter rudis]|uniref:Ecotin n=1 Tax=Acinetobacter rudis CIP 110305 TaxID=421052 RepID=S3N4H0_9GAMM|nr:ecotin family protein [Acinetobacter rudis]EPF73343.1 ecotin [Acinetobacter rudis CIP 110305]